jgi:hypothetical protein
MDMDVDMDMDMTRQRTPHPWRYTPRRGTATLTFPTPRGKQEEGGGKLWEAIQDWWVESDVGVRGRTRGRTGLVGSDWNSPWWWWRLWDRKAMSRETLIVYQV